MVIKNETGYLRALECLDAVFDGKVTMSDVNIIELLDAVQDYEESNYNCKELEDEI